MEKGISCRRTVTVFDEQVTGYDKEGNILGLLRSGAISDTDYGVVDSLSMKYDGNQLISVSDNASDSICVDGFEFKDGSDLEIEYFYDSNGNLTKDLNKKIAVIEYNYLNLPSKIQFENGDSISYVYSGDGTKLRTRHMINGLVNTTDYCGNAIYENGVAKLLLTERGYITLSDTVYHYFLQDHQGNNRVIVDQNGTVEEVNHYYPFGGVFAHDGDVQPYKYNGKELDTKGGLNLYDYGARHYDPALGRFMTVDPMAEKYYGWSPCAYCLGNPLKYVDSDGKQSIPISSSTPLPIYYPTTSKKYRYPTTYEIKKAVNDGVNSAVNFVRSSFDLGTLATISTVMSADRVINPEYDHQRNRERKEKRELDQNQANVAKSIDTNISGMMPNGDPAPKREPKGEIGKLVIGSGLFAAFIDSMLEPIKSNQGQNKSNASDNTTETKQVDPKQEDKSLWQRIKDIF